MLVYKIVLLILTNLTIVSHAAREILFDTSTNDGRLKWASKISRQSNKERWSQMTLNYQAVEGKAPTYQALAVCEIMASTYSDEIEPDNWVVSSWYEKKHDQARFIKVNAKSNQSIKCKAIGKKFCKEHVELYYRESDVEMPENDQLPNDHTYKKVGNIGSLVGTRKSPRVFQSDTITIGPLRRRYFQLAMRDRGSCQAIGPIQAYYTYCPEITRGLANFPSTFPNAQRAIQTQGTCKNNAGDSEVYMTCSRSGNWTNPIGSCACNPGYQPENGDQSCTPCPENYYKATVGTNDCQKCPRNSISESTGAKKCLCKSGFYRTENEASYVPCSGIPSAPQNLRLTSGNDFVNLHWSRPEDLGGRFDTRYRVTCKISKTNKPCHHNQNSSVVIESLSTTYSQLEPSTAYMFSVMAYNGVTRLSFKSMDEAEQSKSISTEEITTKPLFDAELIIQESHKVKITWPMPKHANRYATIPFQIIGAGIENRTDTNSIWLTGLDPGRSYTVTILPIPSHLLDYYAARISFITRTTSGRDGTSVLPVSTLTPDSPESSQPRFDDLTLLIAIMSIIFLCLIFTLLFCICCRRRSVARKTPPERGVTSTSLLPSIRHINHSPSTTTSNQTEFQPALGQPPRYINRDLMQSSVKTATDTFTSKHPLLIESTSTYSLLNEKINLAVTANKQRYNYIDPAIFSDELSREIRKFVRELNLDMIEELEQIGLGHFSTVSKGILKVKDEEKLIAVKKLQTGSPRASNCNITLTDLRKDFLREAAILGQINHDFVIKIEGVQHNQEPCMIITEFMEHGSLDNFVRSHCTQLQDATLFRLLSNISDGMHYLTTTIGFVHRDLAARNCLITYQRTPHNPQRQPPLLTKIPTQKAASSDEGVVVVSDAESDISSTKQLDELYFICKIADFGLAQSINSLKDQSSEKKSSTEKSQIPLRWTAPEALVTETYTPESEVWSFGVLCWEVLSRGERPYWNFMDYDIYSSKTDPDAASCMLLDRPICCSENTYDQIIFPCFHRNPKYRPDFEQLSRILKTIQPDQLTPGNVFVAGDPEFASNSLGQWLAKVCPTLTFQTFQAFLQANLLTWDDISPIISQKHKLKADLGITDPMVVNHLRRATPPITEYSQSYKNRKEHSNHHFRFHAQNHGDSYPQQVLHQSYPQQVLHYATHRNVQDHGGYRNQLVSSTTQRAGRRNDQFIPSVGNDQFPYQRVVEL